MNGGSRARANSTKIPASAGQFRWRSIDFYFNHCQRIVDDVPEISSRACDCDAYREDTTRYHRARGK
jgi:hypothetical protein